MKRRIDPWKHRPTGFESGGLGETITVWLSGADLRMLLALVRENSVGTDALRDKLEAAQHELAWIAFDRGFISEEDIDEALEKLWVPPSQEELARRLAKIAACSQAERDRQITIEAENAEVQRRWPDEWRTTCTLTNKRERQMARRALRAKLATE